VCCSVILSLVPGVPQCPSHLVWVNLSPDMPPSSCVVMSSTSAIHPGKCTNLHKCLPICWSNVQLHHLCCHTLPWVDISSTYAMTNVIYTDILMYCVIWKSHNPSISNYNLLIFLSYKTVKSNNYNNIKDNNVFNVHLLQYMNERFH
jgi:hypothetical protein